MLNCTQLPAKHVWRGAKHAQTLLFASEIELRRARHAPFAWRAAHLPAEIWALMQSLSVILDSSIVATYVQLRSLVLCISSW